jgi:hypothetical protein
MQCVVRSVDVQPVAADANTRMSMTLRTCVARSLMDMTGGRRADVVPDHFAPEITGFLGVAFGFRGFLPRFAEIPAPRTGPRACAPYLKHVAELTSPPRRARRTRRNLPFLGRFDPLCPLWCCNFATRTWFGARSRINSYFISSPAIQSIPPCLRQAACRSQSVRHALR